MNKNEDCPKASRKVLVAIALLAAGLHAQDIHVHVVAGTPITEAGHTYPTIQYAMDHAPQPGDNGRLYVHIAPGTYAERVMVTANRPRTTFVGDPVHPESVVITAAQNAKAAGGTFFSETVDIESPAFQADGITFENTAGATGQAVAIAVRSDKAIFKHCRFVGDQDTLFADAGRQYYTQSYIAGGVDFIFGNAAAVFDHVEIHEQRAGYVTAQSRTAPAQPTGYVILHSKITADDLGGKSFYLGRPWREYSRVVVIETDLPSQLNPEGWSPWRKGEIPAHPFYAEHKNTGPGAASNARAAWSTQLSAQQAESFQPANFLGGSDHWHVFEDAANMP